VNPFDYLNVLISIIMGLAIANLLSGIVRLMHARHRLKMYWPSLLWTAWLFVVSVQHWWSEFGLHNLKAWTFGGFLGTLFIPVDLYLLCALVLPHRDDDADIDLQEWYFKNRRGFFVLLVALAPLAYVEELLTTGSIHKQPLEAALLPAIALLLCLGLVTRRARTHACSALVVSIVTLFYIGLLFGKLPGQN